MALDRDLKDLARTLLGLSREALGRVLAKALRLNDPAPATLPSTPEHIHDHRIVEGAIEPCRVCGVEFGS